MTAKVKDYFDANWHNIRSEWVHGLKGFNLSNNTTNRIESFFSHVKSLICHRAPLKDMIQNFLQILQTLRTERYYRMVKKYNKRNISTEIGDNSAWFELLIRYAFDHVQAQKAIAAKLCGTEIVLDNDSECTCRFFTSMGLPCRHLFAYRRIHNLDMYCLGLVHDRWTKDYNRHSLWTQPPGVAAGVTSSQMSPKGKACSINQKFKRAHEVTQQIASVMATDYGQTEFDGLMGQMENILTLLNADLPHTVSPPSPATSDNDFTNLIVPPPAMFLATLPSLPEETATSHLDILQNVSMPTKSRKRGRPKGSVTTAIGLPRATK